MPKRLWKRIVTDFIFVYLRKQNPMETIIVKTKFYELIDKVENRDLLEKFYGAFNAAVSEKKGI